VSISIELNIVPEDGKFLTINSTTGIEIGQFVMPTLIVKVYCKNETTPEEIGLEISTKLQATINMTVDNYFLYLNITQAKASQSKFVVDNVGISKIKKNMIDILIETGVQIGIQVVNTEFETPYDLKQLNPEYMMFISQLFINPRVTPFYMDEYIYAGISYLFDAFSMTKMSKLRIEEQFLREQSPALKDIVNKLLF